VAAAPARYDFRNLIGRDDRIRTCYPHTPSVRFIYILTFLQITICPKIYEKYVFLILIVF
jgi:hypothetical protein